MDSGIAADTGQVDVGLAVYLCAAEKERVDASLGGAVEQFAPAVGEAVVVSTSKNRDAKSLTAALAGEQRGSSGNGRCGTDRNVAQGLSSLHAMEAISSSSTPGSDILSRYPSDEVLRRREAPVMRCCIQSAKPSSLAANRVYSASSPSSAS